MIRALAPIGLTITLVACGGATDDSGATAEPATAATTSVADTPPTETPAPQTTGASATPSASAAPEPSAPVVVPEALQFTANLVGGGQLDLSELAGPPVVVWFWAPF